MNKIAIQDMNNFKFLSSLTTNYYDTKIAFVVSKPDLGNNNYSHELMLSDGVTHTKAFSMGPSSQYFWETETTLLVPYAKTDDEKKDQEAMKTVLYRYDTERKTLEYATTLYIPVSSVTVVDKSTWIVTSSLNVEDHTLYEDSANNYHVYFTGLVTGMREPQVLVNGLPCEPATAEHSWKSAQPVPVNCHGLHDDDLRLTVSIASGELLVTDRGGRVHRLLPGKGM